MHGREFSHVRLESGTNSENNEESDEDSQLLLCVEELKAELNTCQLLRQTLPLVWGRREESQLLFTFVKYRIVQNVCEGQNIRGFYDSCLKHECYPMNFGVFWYL